MKKIELFDTDERPNLHIGLRVVKTVISVFICAVLGQFLGDTPFFAMIAAILCIQPTRDKSLLIAFNRTIGTVVGGLFGALLLYVGQWLGITDRPVLYYLLISVALILPIETTLLIRKPSVSAFSCIVFLSVTVSHMTGGSPLGYAFMRTCETLLGIFVSLAVNCAFPMRAPTTPEEQENEAFLSRMSQPDLVEPAPQEEEQVPEAPKE